MGARGFAATVHLFDCSAWLTAQPAVLCELKTEASACKTLALDARRNWPHRWLSRAQLSKISPRGSLRKLRGVIRPLVPLGLRSDAAHMGAAMETAGPHGCHHHN